MQAVKQKPFVVVHLGNLGFERKGQAEKTWRYANRFARLPNLQFIGIDLKRHTGGTTGNWRQITASFDEGLAQLGNSSVSVISSEMSLGHYGPSGNDGVPRSIREYTSKTLAIAHQKLEKGGKVFVTVGNEVLPLFLQAVKDTPFREADVTHRPLEKHEYNRTYWHLARGVGKMPCTHIELRKE